MIKFNQFSTSPIQYKIQIIIKMLSQSRISQATRQFLDTLNEVSNEIITYYFQCETPTQSYKIKRHLTELYTFVYENCTGKPSYEEKMFETFKSALLRHLIKYMEILNASLKQDCVMKTYNLIWDSYKTYLRLLSNRIFSFLNRYYIPANDQQSLIKVGLTIFTKAFLAETNVKVFINPFVKELATLRASKIISNQELLHFSESFLLLDSNNLFPILRNVYMEEAAQHYKRVFEERCNDEPMQYINYVNNLRFFETMLARNCICLTHSEEKQLLEMFNRELVRRYTHIFMCHPYGFYFLLRKHQMDNLKTLQQVYDKNEGFADLKKHLYEFIIDEGNVILSQKSKQISHEGFVLLFYQFYKDYHKLISAAFSKNSEMIISVNSAIEKLLVKFDRITEDLFKYVRSSLDNDNFEDISQTFITIFQKLSYKDEFLALYRSSLQRKVISGTTAYEIEKKFIQTINQICNNEMTSELIKILQDSINSMPASLLPAGDDFRVKVVSQHFWEKKFEDQISLNLTLVEPLASRWTQFEQSYAGVFPKRKLNLLPYETKMTLKLHSGPKELSLKCNLLQACIIFYAIKNGDKQIDEANLINDLTVEKTFVHRFLEDFPNLIIADAEGLLTFNWNFEATDSTVDLDFKVEEEKKVTRHIKQDRDILIQCAIVKIVKNKKQLSFQDLVQEVCHAIKLFRPHPSKIKLVLETLKKKDMLEEMNGAIYYKE